MDPTFKKNTPITGFRVGVVLTAMSADYLTDYPVNFSLPEASMFYL
jgi:hypothetical protein